MTQEAFTEQETLDRYGIVRVPADAFHFGAYRYSNLADAVAVARRHEARTSERVEP